MVGIDLDFLGFFQDLPKCENLINCELSWPETTLTGANRIVDEGFRAFTKYADKILYAMMRL